MNGGEHEGGGFRGPGWGEGGTAAEHGGGNGLLLDGRGAGEGEVFESALKYRDADRMRKRTLQLQNRNR